MVYIVTKLFTGARCAFGCCAIAAPIETRQRRSRLFVISLRIDQRRYGRREQLRSMACVHRCENSLASEISERPLDSRNGISTAAAIITAASNSFMPLIRDL